MLMTVSCAKTPRAAHSLIITDVRAYLESVTVDALLIQLKAKGITQKAFAEQIGMNTRHLAAIKSNGCHARVSIRSGGTVG